MTRSSNSSAKRLALFLVPSTLFLAAMFFGPAGNLFVMRSSAQENRVVPPPAGDEAAGQKETSEIAILAGGCFWGVQGVYQHVKGVTNAVSGYAGGDMKTANYKTVSSGGTGHAETVRVSFDPR